MKEKEKELLDAILDMIDDGDREVIRMINDYLEAVKYYDDILLPYDDEFWNISYLTPADAVNAALSGDIDPNDEYVKFDGCGYPETRNYYTAVEEIKRLYLDDFIKWALDNDYFI